MKNMPPGCQPCKPDQTIQASLAEVLSFHNFSVSSISSCVSQAFRLPSLDVTAACNHHLCLYVDHQTVQLVCHDLRVIDLYFLQHLVPLILQHPLGCLVQVYCYMTFSTKAQRSDPWSCQASET